MIVPAGTVLGLSAILFGIGVFGFLARRNIILMLVSVEVMLNAVNVSLVGFSHHLGDARGQVLALFVIAVAAADNSADGRGETATKTPTTNRSDVGSSPRNRCTRSRVPANRQASTKRATAPSCRSGAAGSRITESSYEKTTNSTR